MNDIQVSLTTKAKFWKKCISFLAKLSITIFILYWILTSVPFQEYQHVWSLFSIQVVFNLLLLILIQISLLALRWYLLARSLGSRLSISNAIFGMLVSYFFSQGLPASIGGDAFRLWWHKKEGLTTSIGLKIILLDRIYGLFTLSALCLSSTFLLVYSLGGTPIIMSLITTAIIVGVLLSLAMLPWRFGLSRLISRLAAYLPKPIRNTVEWLLSVRSALSQQKLSITLFMLITGLLTHLMAVTQVYIVGIALSPEDITFIRCLAAVPPALLISYMPFSIAGWGVREASMVVAFGLLGIKAATAILISLSIGLAILFISLIGGLIWTTAGFRSEYSKSIS